MTPEFLLLIVATALALLFRYFPGLAHWYNPLPGNYKSLIMIGLLVLSALGSYGYVCAGAGEISGIACDQASIWVLLKTLFLAIAVNQGTYLITPGAGGSSPNYIASVRSTPIWIDKYEANQGKSLPKGNPDAPWKDKSEQYSYRRKRGGPKPD